MPSLKIIHTSDWHCGASRDLPEYLSRWKDAFDEIRSKIKKYEPDVFVITGDLFDNRLIQLIKFIEVRYTNI